MIRKCILSSLDINVQYHKVYYNISHDEVKSMLNLLCFCVLLLYSWPFLALLWRKAKQTELIFNVCASLVCKHENTL